jgi:hypothetical protein
MLVPDANVNNVSWCLKAYRLWVFDYVMLNNSHGSTVDKVLMSYAMPSSTQRKTMYRCGAEILLFWETPIEASARLRRRLPNMEFYLGAPYFFSSGRTQETRCGPLPIRILAIRLACGVHAHHGQVSTSFPETRVLQNSS